MWFYNLPMSLIKEVSKMTGAEFELIAAIVSVESNGDTFATRYESNYKWIYKADHYAKLNHITIITELGHQRTSWGLMQVMGAVAREYGYFNNNMPKLCDPKTGLIVGSTYLRHLLNKYNDSVQDAVSAYNYGSNKKNDVGYYKNQEYVNKVLGKYNFLKGL